MRPTSSTAALALLLVANLGCPSSPEAHTSPETTDATKAQEASSPKAGPLDPSATPHANPHAGNPHAQPAAAAAAAPLGPPRDITPSGETREEVVEGLKLSVPTEWTSTTGSNPMRKAELTLPGPGGDAKLVVYRFPGGAGSASANIDRWKGQIDSGESDAAVTSELEVNGLTVTSVDVRGRFAGQAMPGMPPQPPIEAARLLAAAIEGSGDPYYLKLIGPAATLDLWSEAWTKLLASLAPS